MIKINSASLNSAPASGNVSVKSEKPHKPTAGGNDVVVISDEGKRKHIMGQVLATISEPNGSKRHIDR